MEIYLMVRRHKTTILLDFREAATVADIKVLLSGIIKRAPEDQRLAYEGEILDDSKEIRHYCIGRAQNPATIGLMLRDEKTGDFEQLKITPYSEPPELPSAMESLSDPL